MECTGVSSDTRAITEGQLFVALRGNNFNGNKYAESALTKGARYVLVDDHRMPMDERYLLVSDVLKTIQDLALYHRHQLNIPVIGLTGSNGKTTTKELLVSVLSTKFQVSATLGNYNNHIGVPLTLLNATRASELLIVEMGTNQPGDIKELCEMSCPDYGLITNIGSSHLEKLGSVQGVFNEKRYLFDYVIENGLHFFLNVGDPFLASLDDISEKNSNYNAEGGSFGELKLAKKTKDRLLSFIWTTREKKDVLLTTSLSGRYNQENIAAVLQVAAFFGISPTAIGEAIAAYIPDNMRSQIIESEKNTILLDAYNANPSSMLASIKSLMSEHHQSKLFFILGDMLELGEKEKHLHREIVDFLELHGVKEAVLVGEIFSALGKLQYPTYINTQALIESKTLDQISNKVILVKASRGIKLERIISIL